MVRRAVAGGVAAHAPCGATDDLLRKLVEREIEVIATLHVLQLFSGGCAYVASRIVELGGRLLYGSDAGNDGIPLGIDVEELRLLRDAGLTPTEVLASATSRAGEQLGLAPLGARREGAPADVIAARGDAGALRQDLARPLVVLSAGRIVLAPGWGASEVRPPGGSHRSSRIGRCSDTSSRPSGPASG